MACSKSHTKKLSSNHMRAPLALITIAFLARQILTNNPLLVDETVTASSLRA